MSSKAHHLAQINIGRIIAPLDDPRMAGFVAQLDAINALAERTPGFVWRLQAEGGNATSIQAFDDVRLLVNMSVWTSLEALYQYVYRSDHGAAFRQRRQWFEPLDGPALALWWIPAGHIPTLSEAKMRLEWLRQCGPSPAAFTFKAPFTPTGKSVRLVTAPDAQAQIEQRQL